MKSAVLFYRVETSFDEFPFAVLSVAVLRRAEGKWDIVRHLFFTPVPDELRGWDWMLMMVEGG